MTEERIFRCGACFELVWKTFSYLMKLITEYFNNDDNNNINDQQLLL